MLKRAGRGYDPAGVENTESGECAVLCPACPQPGRNLPDNWEEAPKEIRYGQFLSTPIQVADDDLAGYMVFF
jgi:hypothetical protein